jgi:methionyl-tRNA synthetase
VTGRLLVVSPAPTANGDLHLGHIAGPFLAADVFVRWARATGRDVVFATGVQDTSSFVDTTARRLGIEPRKLAARSAEDVQRSLAVLGIEVDGFTGDEERFGGFVVEFVGRLRAAGKLRLRPMMFPYSPKTGRYLVDGYVSGGCPVCLTRGCAGLCESCGHLVLAGELIDPRSTSDPDLELEMREAEVLVLPMEEYRSSLNVFFDARRPTTRPHQRQLLAELMARPLADFPVTFPGTWGIPAPFPEVAGQVINPNAEAAAWSMYCTAVGAETRDGSGVGEDELWRAESEAEVVYFLGFDNTYVFAVGAVAMLLATDGRYVLPAHYSTNEFYELDNEKFSTSRGHVVTAGDLSAEIPRDLIRFHLAVTSPEYQKANFSRSALDEITESRLVQPWNRIAERMDAFVGQGPLPVSERSRGAAARIHERFAPAYELPWFSLARAAETLTEQLNRLATEPADAGDFCHEVEAVLRCAAPILIDLAAQVLPDVAIPAAETARPLPDAPVPADLQAAAVASGLPDVTEVVARPLPRLSRRR